MTTGRAAWRARVRSVAAGARRLAATRLARRPGLAGAEPEARLDGWLSAYFDERLAPIDAACAAGEPGFAMFRELDDEVWAMLLTGQYEGYPNIRARLPDVPDPGLQRNWTGTSGIALAAQGAWFYRAVKAIYAEHGARGLVASRVLDFGCGWGRLTRFFARDLEPGNLYGCDPVEAILEVCRRTRVPATLARSEFLPQRLPFEERFDLVFAFSVFTHLSETAHERCLRAISAAQPAGGILIVTIRPPAYLHHSELMRPIAGELGADPATALRRPRYLFVPHPADPSHPQYEGGEMTYGEAVISLPYVRERWRDLYELLEVRVALGDPYQIVLALRRTG